LWIEEEISLYFTSSLVSVGVVMASFPLFWISCVGVDGGDSGRKWLVEVERDEWCRRRVKPATDCVVQVRGDRSTSFDDADLHSPASEVVDQGGKDAVARSNYDSLETADEEIRIGNGSRGGSCRRGRQPLRSPRRRPDPGFQGGR
jgi:hypothetical protein